VPITQVPVGKNILRGKFVFDDKRDQTGKVVRFKARFVAMGYTQRFREDYFETFASVVVTKSLRILLSILNEDPTHDMEHWDVNLRSPRPQWLRSCTCSSQSHLRSGLQMTKCVKIPNYNHTNLFVV